MSVIIIVCDIYTISYKICIGSVFFRRYHATGPVVLPPSLPLCTLQLVSNVSRYKIFDFEINLPGMKFESKACLKLYILDIC